MGYHHLNLEEREKLYALREQDKSFNEIAGILNRNHSTLSREYRKYAKYGKPYLPCKANLKAQLKSIDQRTKAPLKDHLIFLYVRERLRWGWSPEAISGRLPLDYPGSTIDDETIYRYIYNSKKTRGMKLWRYLKLHRKRRLKTNGRKVKSIGKIPQAVSIDQRPEIVNLRISFGHWETDNMEGKRSDRQAASLAVERLTRHTLLNRLTNHKAKTKARLLIKRLKEFPQPARLTLTADNGHENSRHKLITRKLNLPVYFCHAYHSWEKGTVENTVGRLRLFLPKGESLDSLTNKQLQLMEMKLNNTPRKCLNYLTPCEKMQQELTKLNYQVGALQLRM